MTISKRLALKTLNSLHVPKEQKEEAKKKILAKIEELKTMTREELKEELKKWQ